VTDGNRYLNERCRQLEQALGTVDALAQRGELPDATIAAGELKITPLTNTVPEEAAALMRQAYALFTARKNHRSALRCGSLDGIQPTLYSSKDWAALRRSYVAADRDPCG